MPPGAADEGAQNSLTKKPVDGVESNCSVSCDFCECNTKYTHLVYLGLKLFVFSRLCIDVVQFCSKSLVVTLQKKLSSGSHKAPLTENRNVGVVPT